MRPLVFAALLLSGCAAADPQLTETERAAASAAGVDATVAVQAKAFGTSLERLLATTKDYDEAPAAGILLSTQPKSGRAILNKLREQFAGTPYRAYLREDSFGTGPDKVAIVQVDDLGYLAMVRTDGINYDIDHEQVLDRYKQSDKKYGLQLIGAGPDWLEARFVHPPADWKAFAKEVYAFCPDVVEQGTGTVDALAKEMQSGGLVFLWWDYPVVQPFIGTDRVGNESATDGSGLIFPFDRLLRRSGLEHCAGPSGGGHSSTRKVGQEQPFEIGIRSRVKSGTCPLPRAARAGVPTKNYTDSGDLNRHACRSIQS